MPGLLIYRFDAPIIFVNSSYLSSEIRRRTDQAPSTVSEVLLPAQQINHLDSTGAAQLIALHNELEARGIRLSFAEVKTTLLAAMQNNGVAAALGTDHFYESIAEGVGAFLQRQSKRT